MADWGGGQWDESPGAMHSSFSVTHGPNAAEVGSGGRRIVRTRTMWTITSRKRTLVRTARGGEDKKEPLPRGKGSMEDG